MKIFVAHSSMYDYKNELYLPLRNSQLNSKHKIFLPKEKNEKEVVTKDIIKNSDIVIAEVSYPSTGQGIELGWANVFDIPIICISKSGSKISQSLHKLTDKFISYNDTHDMIEQLVKSIN